MNKKPINIDDKDIPTGSYWKNILLEIYNYAPHNYGESNKKSINEDDHILAKKLKISGYELMLGLSFLQDQNLIKRSTTVGETYSSQFYITKDGFNVALELEKNKNAQTIQYGMFVLTAVLALSSIFSFLKEIYPEQSKMLLVYYLILLTIAGILGIVCIKKLTA